MRILLALACACLAHAQQQVQITNHWNGGFQGVFHVTPDHAVHGWTGHLKFDSPVNSIEVWKGTVTQHTPTDWTISNMPWDADLNPGDDLAVDFLVHTKGDNVPGTTFLIEGNSGNPGNPATTASPGNQATTASPGNQATTAITGNQATTASPGNPIVTNGPAPTSNSGGGGGGSPMKYDYKKALELSILFYDAQRSGKLPANNPIPWRGDSAVGDSGDGHDLSGGWYDAGDNVKFNFPMAYSSWVLNWGMIQFTDGYEFANQVNMGCDALKWPLDYFLKCWIPDQQTLYVQVGDGNADHSFWGRPENMNMARPALKVNSGCHGADVAADTASALASGAILFKGACNDAGYADTLLNAAKSLYTFAKGNRGVYSNCINVGAFYGSSNDQDELAVAAAWLYKATNEDKYLNDAKGFHSAGVPWALSWDDKNIAADLLLYDITQDGAYKGDITGFVNSYMPGGSVAQTPCGLAFRDKWGANRYAGNAAFVATMAADLGINPDQYKKWAMSQINYLLGDNKNHISYEIGFGNKFPVKPHHRGSSCPTDSNNCDINAGGNNPNQLNGALVGGPDQADNYRDVRTDYVQNEVACDYNAGFQGTLAGLSHFAKNNDLPAAPAARC